MNTPRQFFVAVLAALPLLGQAQAPAEAPKPEKPLFQLYGTLDANLQNTQALGATTATAKVKSRYAVSIDSSNIGWRGGKDLNEWIGVTWQCETGASVDGIGNAALCNRNSRVGLTGAWGTLFYGNWDTPYKAQIYGTKADDPFNKTDVFGFNSLMGSPGFNYRSSGWIAATSTAATPGAIGGFDVRAGNSVGFHSPSLMGLSAKIQWGTNEFKNASGTLNPELISASLNFDSGPVSVSVAAEQHSDAFGLVFINAPNVAAFGASTSTSNGILNGAAANSSKDVAIRVAAGYEQGSPLGTTTLSGMFEQLDYKQDHAAAGTVKEYKRNAWSVALKHRYDDEELRVRYTVADKGTATLASGGGSTDGYGAKELVVGYAHYFAKNAQVYLSYAKITNEKNAQYTFSIGGSPGPATGTPKGADPQAVGLGLRYSF